MRLLRVGILGTLLTFSFIFWIRLYSLDQVLAKLNQFPEVCPLRTMFHLKCAFCGMTHAWIHLFFGDWKGAIRENLFSIPLFLAFIGMLGVWISGRSDIIPEEKRKTLGGTALLLLCAYTLVRNLSL